MIWAWVFLALPLAVSSLSYNRKACQKIGNVALKGCPKNTLLVGPHGVHKSIQHAVLSIPDNDDPYTIVIEPGNYTEQVNITRQSPLTLLGMTASPNDKTKNLVNIIWHNATGAGIATFDNAYTSTLTVAPTLNASFTGTGPTGWPIPAGTPFGNSDFRVYNLDFTNDYLPWAAGPSLALSLSYANGAFYYSRFLSYQDTVSQTLPSLEVFLLIPNPDLRRQTGERFHVRLRGRRPNRFLLRLWDLLGDELAGDSPRLWRRYHGLEGYENST
jgi:hypothetical protein